MSNITEPSEKSPEMEKLLEETAGRTTAITSDKCVPAPIGCGREVDPKVDAEFWSVAWMLNRENSSLLPFRDELSLKEYTISGLCQTCQDSIGGGD